MLGALAGDIIGSIYEWDNIKTTEFPLFAETCFFTDDSVLTVALADSIMNGLPYGDLLKSYVHRYPDAGYGGHFRKWVRGATSEPYNSCGNGAAMRISPAGWAWETLEEVLEHARRFTEVTHDHPEGVKGGQATAAAVFLARKGASKNEIRQYVEKSFGYDLSRSCNQIRPWYRFDGTCQGTVPEAFAAFFDADGFESAIRLAVSLGGDTDTLACITGSIAEAFYGMPDWIEERTMSFLDRDLRAVTDAFRQAHVLPKSAMNKEAD